MFRLISILAVTAMMAAAPASAFGLKLPVKLPGGLGPEGAAKKLKVIDREVKDANNSLNNINYGKDADRELSAIKKAEELIKSAKTKTGITLKMANGYQQTLKNIAATEKRIENAKLAHECTKALLAIYRAQKTPKGARDADFKKLETAARKFEKANPEGFDKIVTFYIERLQYVKDKNEELIAAAKAKAEKQAADKKAREEREARQAAEKKARAALKKVSEAHKAVKNAFQREIDSDLVAAYEEAIQDDTLSDAHKAAFNHTLFHMKAEEAFKGGNGKKASKTIAKLVNGKAVTGGSNKPKNIKISFKTKKNSCYFVFTRFDKPKSAKLSNWQWKQQGSGALPQVFRTHDVEGVCTLKKPKKMTLTAKADYPGTRNALNYAVVEIPRNKIPMTLTAHMSIVVQDHCDLDWWASLWKNPIPGTIAYRKHEPVLIASSSGGRLSYFNVVSTSWNGSQVGNVTHEVPNLVEFSSKYRNWRCDTKNAVSANSIKIKKCEEKIWNKYKKRYKALQEKVDSARDHDLWNITAEKKIADMDLAMEKQDKKKCEPLRKKVNAQAEKLVNNLIDEMTDKPPVEKMERLQYLMLENQAGIRN